MKVYLYQPYKVCIGRKYRHLPKLYKPFTLLISGNFCDQYFSEKNKIRFINQFIRWFYKSRWGYKISFDIKLEHGILEGNSIILCARTQKAAFKNLLAKLNYELSDYKALKRRQYILNFIFLFLNIHDDTNNLISIDILSLHEDMFKIFIVVNGSYIEDFNNILYYYNTFIYNISYDNDKINEISYDNFDLFYKNINLENLENFYINNSNIKEKKAYISEKSIY
jgi:hypothetical protein